MRRFKRLVCFFRGHTLEWKFEGEEFVQRCTTCGTKVKNDWKGRFW